MILRDASGIPESSLPQLIALLDKAPPRLAFNKLQFAKELLRSFHGEARKKVVDVIAYQSFRHGGGVFTGDPRERMAEEARSFRDAVDAIPVEAELDDLMRALRRFFT